LYWRTGTVAPPEEQMAFNSMICDVAVIKAKERLDEWDDIGNSDLVMRCNSKSELLKALKAMNITEADHASLEQQQRDLQECIRALVNRRKALQSDLSMKRKALAAARAKFKQVQWKKKKIETLFLAKKMLLQHNISAAAHHGGKLNGIDCCELIQLTKQIFGKIETYVLSSSNPDRCSDNTIINTCSLYQDCFVTVDKLSKLRRKHGEPDEEDYKVAERALDHLEFLWKLANLSYTPKIYGLLVHEIYQMRYIEGIGETLEDDIEHSIRFQPE
jgi:hypothetical protein